MLYFPIFQFDLNNSPFNFFKGLVDPSKELAKLQQRQTNLTNQRDKLQKAMGVEGYQTKVPEKVQQANTDKVSLTL